MRIGRGAAVLAVALAAATCATGSNTGAKYPRRPPNCAIRVFHSSTPGVQDWDDIGMAEVSCYLEDGPSTCLARLRAEGCQRGGDLLYDVPKRPERPTERAMVYRGHVAHTKVAAKPAEPEEPVPAATGPVIPIGTIPTAAPTVVDAGTADAGGAPSPTP